MSQAAEQVRTENSPNGAGAPARRLCPYCGTVNESVEGQACGRCGMEDTPATRAATRARIGPWHVLQSRNPAAPGMKFSTLLSLVKKGQVTQRSIVRGPTTSQLWTVAARVKGLSREFGLCYHCNGSIEPAANFCPHCQKLQEPPINPDVLLEGSAVSEAAGLARRSRTSTTEPAVNADIAATTAPAGKTSSPPPKAAIPSGILSARDLATAFQLDIHPKPPPAPRRRRRVRVLVTMFLLIGAAAAIAYVRPDWREESIGWVKQTTAQILARLEARSPADETLDASERPAEKAAPDSMMAAPTELPTASEPDDKARKAADVQKPSLPVDERPVVEQSAPPVVLSEDAMLDQVRTLWRAAINAEADQDFTKAVRNYEQIRQLPRQVWPMGLDVRLAEARKRMN